jgi:hypothetical protein
MKYYQGKEVKVILYSNHFDDATIEVVKTGERLSVKADQLKDKAPKKEKKEEKEVVTKKPTFFKAED